MHSPGLAIDEGGLETQAPVVFAHAAGAAIAVGLERKRDLGQRQVHMTPSQSGCCRSLATGEKSCHHVTQRRFWRLAHFCPWIVLSCWTRSPRLVARRSSAHPRLRYCPPPALR